MINNKTPRCRTQGERLAEQRQNEQCQWLLCSGGDSVTIATCFGSCSFRAPTQEGPVSPPRVTLQGERSHSGETAGPPCTQRAREGKETS